MIMNTNKKPDQQESIHKEISLKIDLSSLPKDPVKILEKLIELKQANKQEPSPNNDPLRGIKARYALNKIGKITTVSELIELIQHVSDNGKIDKDKFYSQVSKLELFNFVFEKEGAFLLTAAENFGFQCLEILDDLGFGPHVVWRMFGSQSKVSEVLVKELNSMAISLKDKTKLLERLMRFNKKGAEEVVKNFGNEDTRKILEQIQQEAKIKKELSRDDGSFEEFQIEPELVNVKMMVGDLSVQELQEFNDYYSIPR